jgi:hypothetical protein
VLLPAAQFGDWPDVKKRMRRVVARIKGGESIVGVMTEDGMLDTDDTRGMLIMGGTPHRGWKNFHCFMPWRALWQALLEPPAQLESMSAVFRDSLTVPWGVLGLLSYESQVWFLDTARLEPFLVAAIGAWDQFEVVGPRYFTAVQGTTLWSIPNNLHYVLANMGVPGDVLRAPLPAEGPRGLLRHAQVASGA